MIMSFDDDDDDDISNTSLGVGLHLGLGLHSDECMKRERQKKKKEEDDPSNCNNNKACYPSLTLGPIDEDEESNIDQLLASKNDQLSAVSSYSNSSISIIKKERDKCLGEEFEGPSTARDDEDHGCPIRKKLRLTKEQSSVLERNFKENSNINSKLKVDLATKLNMQTRQVEVWFQNRRARTKLKQTESDCELLKNYCETLTQENKKLKTELQELKSMQGVGGPFYMQIPAAAATLTICPSCDPILGSNNNMINGFYRNNSIHSTAHHLRHA